MPAPFQPAVRWLLLLALTVPLAVGVTGVGDRQAGATAGSPAAVAVRFALGQLGKPYRWGTDRPRSYDCSGLVQTAYCAAGVALPRVSRQQYGAGRHVRPTALRAGDLLFYADDPRDPRTIGHVGMYVGSGRMVEAHGRAGPCGSPPSGAPACSAARPGPPPACAGCCRSSSASAATRWPPSSSGWPPTGSAWPSTATSGR
jgi:cell wall-associated NlpC family hydrolase